MKQPIILILMFTGETKNDTQLLHFMKSKHYSDL